MALETIQPTTPTTNGAAAKAPGSHVDAPAAPEGPKGTTEPVDAADGQGEASKEPPAAAEGKDKDGKKPKEGEEAEADGIPTSKETAYGRAVRQREARIVAREQRHATARAETERREAAVATERAEIAKRREHFASLEAEAKSDPIALVRRLGGYTDADLARRFLGDGKASAQEEQRRAKEAEDKRLEAANARIEALEKAAKDKEEREKRELEAKQTEETNRKTVADFSAHAKTLAEKYPHAARLLAGETLDQAISDCNVIALGMKAEIDAAAAKGKPMTRQAIWNLVLEKFDAKVRKYFGEVAPTPSGTKGSGEAAQGNSGADDDTATPTLTGKSASQRRAIPIKDDPLLSELDPELGRQKAIEAGEAAEREYLRKRKAEAGA